MNKNKLIVISLVLLTAIFGTFYFFRYSYGLTVYKNEIYGFSIKYPADWRAQENFEQAGILKLTAPDSKDQINRNYGIIIRAGSIPKNIGNLTDAKNYSDSTYGKSPLNPAYNSKLEKIGSFDALVVRGVQSTHGGAGLEVIILNNNSLIQFSGNEIPDNEKILNSIRPL